MNWEAIILTAAVSVSWANNWTSAGIFFALFLGAQFESFVNKEKEKLRKKKEKRKKAKDLEDSERIPKIDTHA